MIFDVDDLHETNHRLDLLAHLKAANPAFRMTAFCVPAHCSDAFLENLPDWIECVPHGWDHGGPRCPDPFEAAHWTRWQTRTVIAALHPRFVQGWKSPGWQISQGTYQALAELGYWVADQHYNDHRRPPGLPFHCEGDGQHEHHHVQDWGSNGLSESWDTLLPRVEAAESFALVSEVVRLSEPVLV